LKRLLPRLEGSAPPAVKYMSLRPLLPACRDLLSGLAHQSGSDAEATTAFRQAMAKLVADATQETLQPREKSGLKAIDAALDQLAGAAPMLKKRIIEACAECISADQRVTIEEAELLRVISDALDCPMPPLVAQSA
jgi:hypothetical protein